MFISRPIDSWLKFQYFFPQVKYLSKLVEDMAWDLSSPTVRLAVLQGLIYLLENPLSHAVLRPLLPKLARLLKDADLRVRVAAVDFLLAIKGIRALPFHKVGSLSVFSEKVENLILAECSERWILYSSIRYCTLQLATVWYSIGNQQCLCVCFLLKLLTTFCSMLAYHGAWVCLSLCKHEMFFL